MSSPFCHWPDCIREPQVKLWACREHWSMLPAVLRGRIWATYVPGQVRTTEYLHAARAVQDWIREQA